MICWIALSLKSLRLSIRSQQKTTYIRKNPIPSDSFQNNKQHQRKRMKKLDSIVAALAMFAVAGTTAFIGGCKTSDSNNHGSGHVHQYTCPHHPEVVQSTAGTCPKCGMKLVHKE
jgi:hypothetical protein